MVLQGSEQGTSAEDGDGSQASRQSRQEANAVTQVRRVASVRTAVGKQQGGVQFCVLKAELTDSAVGLCEVRYKDEGGFGSAECEDGGAAKHREDSGSSSVGS